MVAVVDMTGKVCGYWTVLERSGTAKNRMATWLCMCRCGATEVIAGADLRAGNRVSCRACKVARAKVAAKMRVSAQDMAERRAQKWERQRKCSRESARRRRARIREERIAAGDHIGEPCKLIDLTGMRIGEWTVLSRTVLRRHWYWLCRCSCGTEREVCGTSLRERSSTRCRECATALKRRSAIHA